MPRAAAAIFERFHSAEHYFLERRIVRQLLRTRKPQTLTVAIDQASWDDEDFANNCDPRPVEQA